MECSQSKPLIESTGSSQGCCHKVAVVVFEEVVEHER